ncbi:MAG: methylated-DNA--[protein]-cysteine S-methyltransferase [Bdellovibrionales bacterium]
MEKSIYFYSELDSPVGRLVAVFSENALNYLLFDFEAEIFLKKIRFKKIESHPFKKKLEDELKEYFQGKRSQFSIPLNLKGTEFQLKAWHTLQLIPYGQTMTYTEQARAMNSQAVRAVGTANSKNPINIIIPCHRVTRQNGELGGYVGGVEIKKRLLQLESQSCL